MKILYTHRTQGVGAEGAHILGMYEAFAETGHTVFMDCLPGCNPAAPKQSPATTAPAPSVTSASPAAAATAATSKPPPSLIQRIYWFIAENSPETIFELFELAYNVLLFVRLASRYARFRPDLIYERYALNTFAPTLLCRITGCRHVLEVNDSVVIERSRPLALKGLAAAVEGYCLGGSQLAITITADFQARLGARFPAAKDRILVLTNAMSGTRFQRAFDREGMRKRLGMEGRIVIGASGQFLPWHGLMELLDGLGSIAREKDLFFLFIGDGPVKEAILARAQELGISDRVRFTGMVPITEVPDYLSAVDIAVIPSAAQHASPMKLMEYMGAGLPIVAPDLPSIHAAADDTMAAIFPAQDFGAMRESILRLLANRAEANTMGARARAHAMAELTWAGHAHKVVERLGSSSTASSGTGKAAASAAGGANAASRRAGT